MPSKQSILLFTLKSMRRQLLLFSFLSWISFSLRAQNNRISDHNNIFWSSANVSIKLNQKFKALLEYQWRRTDWTEHWQQSLTRIAIEYKLSTNVFVRAGFAWVLTFPYGDYSIQSFGKKFPEYRPFQALVLTSKFGRVEMTQRLMNEQRFIGKYYSPSSTDPDVFVFSGRIRYQLKAQFPLGNIEKEKQKWYAMCFDEIFIGYGKNVGENIFDQNRLALLTGYYFTPSFRMEAGFFQQILQLGREVNEKNVFQYNNGMMVNTHFTF